MIYRWYHQQEKIGVYNSTKRSGSKKQHDKSQRTPKKTDIKRSHEQLDIHGNMSNFNGLVRHAHKKWQILVTLSDIIHIYNLSSTLDSTEGTCASNRFWHSVTTRDYPVEKQLKASWTAAMIAEAVFYGRILWGPFLLGHDLHGPRELLDIDDTQPMQSV